jgi:hypothetical protein
VRLSSGSLEEIKENLTLLAKSFGWNLQITEMEWNKRSPGWYGFDFEKNPFSFEITFFLQIPEDALVKPKLLKNPSSILFYNFYNEGFEVDKRSTINHKTQRVKVSINLEDFPKLKENIRQFVNKIYFPRLTRHFALSAIPNWSHTMTGTGVLYEEVDNDIKLKQEELEDLEQAVKEKRNELEDLQNLRGRIHTTEKNAVKDYILNCYEDSVCPFIPELKEFYVMAGLPYYSPSLV